MKKGFILLFLVTLLFSDEQKPNEFENPFEFLLKNGNLTESFTKEVLEIPKNAKMLKYIDISFEDESGKIEKKTIVVDKSIRSKNNIVISSDDIFNTASFAYSPVIEASLMTTPKLSLDKVLAQANNDKNIEVVAIKDIKDVKIDEPTKITNDKVLAQTKEVEAVKVTEPTKIASSANSAVSYKLDMISSGGTIKLGEIAVVDSGLFIKTDNKILKTINMTKENKIVLDFDKKLPQFRTKTFKLNSGGFVSATMGAHPDYYRMSITINGKYNNFEVKEVADGYIVVLK